MGKKDKLGQKRRRDEDSDEDEVDPELQAELNALMSMRAEKGLSEAAGADMASRTNNKDGLLRALQAAGAAQLSFKESMQICQFDLEVEDENDDLAREVNPNLQRDSMPLPIKYISLMLRSARILQSLIGCG